MGKQIAIILFFTEEAVIRLFGDIGRATQSNTDTKVISVIPTAVNKTVEKGFLSAVFHTKVKQAVHKSVSEPKTVYSVRTRMIDAHALTVPAGNSVKHEVDKISFEKSKMEKQFSKLGKAVNEKEGKGEDVILRSKMN